MSVSSHLGERIDVVNGMRIRSLAGGTGQAVVFLHGDGESAFDWTWVLADLVHEYQVFAPDLPGSGGSDKPAINYTVDFYDSFLQGYLNTLGLDGAILVGNSLGGLVALSVALHAAQRVSGLVLVDSAGLGNLVSPALVAEGIPGFGEVLLKWAKTPLGAVQRARSRAWLLFADSRRAPAAWLQDQENLARSPGFLEANISALRSNLCLGLQRVVMLDDLERLDVPLQVIWGRHDRIVPVQQAYEATRRSGQEPAIILSGAGHIPHVERPDAFLKALSPFLQSHAA